MNPDLRKKIEDRGQSIEYLNDLRDELNELDYRKREVSELITKRKHELNKEKVNDMLGKCYETSSWYMRVCKKQNENFMKNSYVIVSSITKSVGVSPETDYTSPCLSCRTIPISDVINAREITETEFQNKMKEVNKFMSES